MFLVLMFPDIVKSRPVIGSTVVDYSCHRSNSVVAVGGDSTDDGDQTEPPPLIRQQQLPRPILERDLLDLGR